jgi:hypothetical protein
MKNGGGLVGEFYNQKVTAGLRKNRLIILKIALIGGPAQ